MTSDKSDSAAVVRAVFCKNCFDIEALKVSKMFDKKNLLQVSCALVVGKDLYKQYLFVTQ